MSVILQNGLLKRERLTFGVRMAHIGQDAQKIAEYLSAHIKVTRVLHPALVNHDGHDIQMKQANSGDAILSFDVNSAAHARSIVQFFKMPVFSVCLGAVDIIISFLSKMGHAALNARLLANVGISPGLLCFSVGLEDTDDLIADLEQSLVQI
ncbi:PLP-dependent transferase [Leuconostoc gasicomitatum]|uniref:PLP-dependent transferase n=1 Tax=Leuconostoc gasicomitatum TaxID=115778 RepID=UPI0007449340|nr:PLP-dependent transferase [Leuconostoc gasicomitatum]MBR2276663.1 PLP-dependent transferase [Leuconostoc sp.]MBZ5953870.1 PLP-dependent transferase [Leuconostoc gasicomitatum]MBZ5955340.1 PLP-dependent transferase [Leuconostoc gasicomitatum]MBZ5987447.1 PLP-dependent transferase [Leuconostoc gasicomitatum]MBZ5990997.1 PLP-dependent transferase [Leuconostoc gasicomitatum]